MEASDFSVEDLLDLSTGGDDVINDAFFAAGCSTESSTVTAVDSCNSSVSGGCADVNFSSNYHFTGELCVPYEDMAELEWLSTFVEESFSTEDLHKLHFLPCAAPSTASSARHFYHHHHPTTLSPTATPSVPGKARSKRSRAAPCDWSSRLLVREKSPQIQHSTCADTPSSEVRRCLHCAAEKTPQWRTGPMGPKTLCNACGVRHKSGRLVPEYRPAASPTFVSTKHSNSHRKVMELRRQKELQQQQPVVINSGMFGVSSSSSSSNGEDYLIHHHMGGPDYRQMI